MEEIRAINDETWNAAQTGEIAYWQAKQVKDGEPFKRLRYLKILAPYIGDTKDLVVVDDGAGPKGILHLIPFKIGVAIDPLMKKFKHAGYRLDLERFAAVQGSGEDIPLPDSYADQVYSLNALDHAQDAGKMFGEMVRIAKPGGMVCVIVDFRLPENRTPTHQMCLSNVFFDQMEAEHGLTKIVREEVKKCSGTAETGFLGVWRKKT